MTDMTQAPIHPWHKDMTAKAAGFRDWTDASSRWLPQDEGIRSILAHAQTLANLEAARADLAEIDRIAVAGGLAQCLPGDPCLEIATIAAPYRARDPFFGSIHTDGSRSGGQPVTECPKCEAFKREVSDACKLVDGFLERDRNSEWKTSGDARKTLRRFIIPASDPVADAFKAAVYAYGGEAIEGENFNSAVAVLRAFIEGDR